MVVGVCTWLALRMVWRRQRDIEALTEPGLSLVWSRALYTLHTTGSGGQGDAASLQGHCRCDALQTHSLCSAAEASGSWTLQPPTLVTRAT